MEGIRDAYASGRGSVRCAAVHAEPLKGGKDALIVSELPFMVKKGGESARSRRSPIWSATRSRRGISDLRDESDRSGCASIEVKRGADPNIVTNNLYKRTQPSRPSASTWWRWSTGCRAPSR